MVIDSKVLHDSILEVFECSSAVNSQYPTDYYFDPETCRVVWWTRIGPGIPIKAYHNIWIKLFQAPAGAIRDSIVDHLLALKERFLYDAQHNFLGVFWDGRNYKGLWRDKPNYSSEFQIEIAFFWDPADWFEPVLYRLKRKCAGMTAEQIVDSEDLGNVDRGIVPRDAAIKWIAEMIDYWNEEEEQD